MTAASPARMASAQSRSGRKRGPVAAWLFSSKSLAMWTVRGILLMLVTLVLEVVVRAELVNPFFVPRPTDFLPRMVQNFFEPKFLSYTGTTFAEIGVAFLGSAILGLGIGFLLWRFGTLGRAYEPLVAALFSSPLVLLYPVFVIFFGRTPLAIVALATIFSTLPIILYTRQALSSVSPTFLKVGTSLNLSEWSNFRHILIPAAAPTIFTGFRIGLTYVLIVVIAMEFILQIGGLGNFISEVALRFRAIELYAGVTLVILLSAVFIAFTYKIENMVRR